ncbi:hypothetical protein APHAL10511_006886 [Amanita phalloides]|nr:hypothetical protein APHAL10511_006886 [Amanita phalloides]
MSLEEELNKIYPLKTEGDAQFFKTPKLDPAFRLEVPELGWEFSDGFWIGSEIKGTLYYKEGVFGGILPADRATKAYFFGELSTGSPVRYVRITFYAPGSEDGVLGEFIGKDVDDVSGSTGLLNKRILGEWKKVDYAVGKALAFKEANSPLITITSDELGKKVEFECTPTDRLYGVAIDHPGRLTVKDLATINKSNSARWYHDYVVFYEGHHSKVFTAFFFPDAHLVNNDNQARVCNNVQISRAIQVIHFIGGLKVHTGQRAP